MVEEVQKIIEEVGNNGDDWCPILGIRLQPTLYNKKLMQIKKIAEKEGRNPENIVFLGHVIMSMEKDYDSAFQKYEAMMKPRLRDRDFTEELKTCIVGIVDDCITGIEKYVKAGLNHLIHNPYPHLDNLK